MTARTLLGIIASIGVALPVTTAFARRRDIGIKGSNEGVATGNQQERNRGSDQSGRVGHRDERESTSTHRRLLEICLR